jgi:hypothetical protein
VEPNELALRYGGTQSWIANGLLLGLGSLLEMCIGADLAIEGTGRFNRDGNFSIPGDHCAQGPNGKHIADGELFYNVLSKLSTEKVEPSRALIFYRFYDCISTQNLINYFLLNRGFRELYRSKFPKERPKSNHQAADPQDIIDFVADVKELEDLGALHLSASRNRTSHANSAFNPHDENRPPDEYLASIYNRFYQLTCKCICFVKLHKWRVMDSEQENRTLLGSIENSFFNSTKIVLPNEDLSANREVINAFISGLASRSEQETPDRSKFAPERASKEGLLHDMLEEFQYSVHVENCRLIQNIEFTLHDALRELKASLTLGRVQTVTEGRDSYSFLDLDLPEHPSLSNLSQLTRCASQEQREIAAALRTLNREIRNTLHDIDDRFDYCHSVLQAEIALDALLRGVGSYHGLKQTREFKQIIQDRHKSFMLTQQEEMYAQRIDKLLAPNKGCFTLF